MEEVTETKRERMERLFAEVEAELHPDRAQTVTAPAVPQKVTDELNRIAREKRLRAQDHSQMVQNASQMLKANAFRTKWERVLAEKYVDLYNIVLPKKEESLGYINTELNVLRNFATAVDLHLTRAERTAREQDNHHYYKIFAEIVRALLQKL